MIDTQSRISPINGYKSIYINQFTISELHHKANNLLRRYVPISTSHHTCTYTLIFMYDDDDDSFSATAAYV